MEDEEMQTGGLGGQSPSVNLGTLATERAFAAQTDILKQQQALAKQRYEEGRQRIEQMRLGPTRSEQLMAISQALLSPSPYRNRFKGTLANLSQVAGPMVGANRRAELEKAEMLRQLTEQYEDRALNVRKTAADLGVELAKAAKPRTLRSALHPVTGEVVNLDTGEKIEPVSSQLARVPQEASAQLRAYYADPGNSQADKNATLVNFMRRFGVDQTAVVSLLQGGR